VATDGPQLVNLGAAILARQFLTNTLLPADLDKNSTTFKNFPVITFSELARRRNEKADRGEPSRDGKRIKTTSEMGTSAQESGNAHELTFEERSRGGRDGANTIITSGERACVENAAAKKHHRSGGGNDTTPVPRHLHNAKCSLCGKTGMRGNTHPCPEVKTSSGRKKYTWR